MTPQEQTAKLLTIFLPYAVRCRERMITEKGRFVHYTSAANALSIIQSRRIWMRNTTCMSDYREVRHGLDMINRYFNNADHKAAFDGALDDCHPGIANEIFTTFNQWWLNTQLQTYITSISEHDNREDVHGRLSMWRAFGGGATARVALVLKSDIIQNQNVAPLQLLLNPVGYFTDQEFETELDSVISNIRSERDFLRTLNHPMLVHTVFLMHVAHVVCSKHEGFHEEREWRIIYSPTRSPSPFVESAIEVVSGIPHSHHAEPLGAANKRYGASWAGTSRRRSLPKPPEGLPAS
jgi:hypothetical protein